MLFEAPGGAARIVLEPTGPGVRLVASGAGGRVVHRAEAVGFSLVEATSEIRPGPAGSPPLVAVLAEGAGGCCRSWHFFTTDASRGLVFLGQAPAAVGRPSLAALARSAETLVLIADPAFDGWAPGLGPDGDLRPPVALRLRAGRLRAEGAAMRRTVAEALGPTCEATRPDGPAGEPPPETVEQAARRIRALPWSPTAEARLARWSLCLVYAGRAVEARRLLGLGWPAHTPGARQLEDRLGVRLACSPYVTAVREANEPGQPFLASECPARS
jgi:hypothetical protein